MKLMLLLCLLPVVLCAPNARFIIDSLGGSLFDLDTLKCDMQLMLDVVGSDPGEAQCEAECHNLVKEGHVLNYGCPLVCHGFQNLVHLWHIVPDTTDPSTSLCNKPATTGK